MKVRDVLRLLHEAGWVEAAVRGSHRQLKHPTKTGRVTVPGKPNDDLALGTLNSILKQAGLPKKVNHHALRGSDRKG
jgi:predicted RNA binding protein YcfA (HicA-like mRNA interferase family)